MDEKDNREQGSLTPETPSPKKKIGKRSERNKERYEGFQFLAQDDIYSTLQDEDELDSFDFFRSYEGEEKPLTSRELLTNLSKNPSKELDSNLDLKNWVSLNDSLDRIQDDMNSTSKKIKTSLQSEHKPSKPLPSRSSLHQTSPQSGPNPPAKSQKMQQDKAGQPEEDNLKQQQSAQLEQQEYQRQQSAKEQRAKQLAQQQQAQALAEEKRKEEELFQIEPVKKEREDQDRPIDPDSSFKDDTDYGIYVDKKRLWLPDYERIEQYLESQARNGYEFQRHERKRYYFHQSDPKNTYFEILYFENEPDQAQLAAWQKAGWKVCEHEKSEKRREFGWYILSNEEEEFEYRKHIENEDEKFRYFHRLAKSYRSTCFLLFIVFVVSAVALGLQFYLKAMYYYLIPTGIILALSFFLFLYYVNRMRKAQRQVRLMEARIRINEKNLTKSKHESDEELETDWKALEARESQ